VTLLPENTILLNYVIAAFNNRLPDSVLLAQHNLNAYWVPNHATTKVILIIVLCCFKFVFGPDAAPTLQLRSLSNIRDRYGTASVQWRLCLNFLDCVLGSVPLPPVLTEAVMHLGGTAPNHCTIRRNQVVQLDAYNCVSRTRTAVNAGSYSGAWLHQQMQNGGANLTREMITGKIYFPHLLIISSLVRMPVAPPTRNNITNAESLMLLNNPKYYQSVLGGNFTTDQP
jgi:hypothetical protein